MKVRRRKGWTHDVAICGECTWRMRGQGSSPRRQAVSHIRKYGHEVNLYSTYQTIMRKEKSIAQKNKAR